MAKGDRKEVFHVVERKGLEKPYWLKIGAAFENGDGSLSVILDALPAGGSFDQDGNPAPGVRLQIRDPYEEPADDKNSGKGNDKNSGKRR